MDGTSFEQIGTSFEQIAQEILRQKRIMEQMEEENRELRSQLADLREGRGIFFDICGTRFSLTGEYLSSSSETDSMEVPVPQSDGVEHAEESTLSTLSPMMAIPETPRPNTGFFADDEEVMSEERGTDATSPMVAWSEEQHRRESINEEEKAELRRQLIGSFLLE